MTIFKYNRSFLLSIILTHLFISSSGQIVKEYMDLQIHTSMHIPYPMFGKAFTYFEKGHDPHLTYKHTLKNVCYANYLEHNSGSRIIINGALGHEFVKSAKKARKLVMKQIDFVNRFAEEHSDNFVVAKTPAEVREYINNTNKTVIIHSIENGRKLVNSAEDAKFWAGQGVSFITLIHLADINYGGGAIWIGLAPKIINLRGVLRKNENRRLTEEGKQAILWLANAGIMTDVTHMCDQTRKDAIAFMTENKIPTLSTHAGFRPIQNHDLGLDSSDIINIYKGNGLVGLASSGKFLKPHHPDKKYKSQIDGLESYCNGSIDSYKFTYNAMKDLIENNISSIFNDSTKTLTTLTEEEKVKIAIGYQSDFNGWLDHHRPRYGKKGCYDEANIPDTAFKKIETIGLAHPGMMEEHWNLLEKEGVDLEPIKLSSEKFLQMWEYLQNRKTLSGTTTTLIR